MQNLPQMGRMCQSLYACPNCWCFRFYYIVPMFVIGRYFISLVEPLREARSLLCHFRHIIKILGLVSCITFAFVDV